jgi:hypothetical protein
VANTLVPFYLFLSRPNHYAVNSIYGPSPNVVRFYFQYWNTLPFAVGITYFFFMLKLLWQGGWRARQWLLAVFLPPFLCFSLYWGYGSSGMMREGLHPWFLGLLIFSVVLWRKAVSARRQVFTLACVLLLVRGVETLLMLMLPSILTEHALWKNQFAASDLIALVGMIACAGILYGFTYRHALTLSKSFLQNKSGSFHAAQSIPQSIEAHKTPAFEI